MQSGVSKGWVVFKAMSWGGPGSECRERWAKLEAIGSPAPSSEIVGTSAPPVRSVGTSALCALPQAALLTLSCPSVHPHSAHVHSRVSAAALYVPRRAIPFPTLCNECVATVLKT